MFSSISIPQPNKQTDLDSDSTPRNDSLDINRSFFGRGMLPAPRKIQDPPAASPVRKKRGDLFKNCSGFLVTVFVLLQAKLKR